MSFNGIITKLDSSNYNLLWSKNFSMDGYGISKGYYGFYSVFQNVTDKTMVFAI